MFSALLIEKGDAGQTVGVAELDEAQLPAGPDDTVSVDVEYSTLNYKDGLAITGKSPVVRSFPMIPGIDLAGVVTQSSHADWNTGDRVVLNGWGVGETHWGGLAQRARLNGDWLIPLPAAFTTRQAMAIGTAGYTASLCVDALLRQGVSPDRGEVLVTGATGGVGSVAIALLRAAGFTVAAATGKSSEEPYLKQLGAETVRALGLPEGVVDIVAQHHGNAVIAWFYDQARKTEGDVDADDFSYPGLPPASREAAVVMLADSVEASTRTLKKPTASRLEDFIREIIMDKVRDGQLDRCDLTFKDIDTIRDSFTRILAGHFHSRIEYPKLKEQLR